MTPTNTHRARLVTAVQYEITRGLLKGELDLPRQRLTDYGWLARNAAINNHTLRGNAIRFLAQAICDIDTGAA